ncbi:ArsR/SmtB family transcription factor [Pyxidicoccus xibeiensis]|uniref:ArsR/SmtB family transcription factor n=1 Tax=Pyxidicoccus xibeiensis TaxID=2906759 RepID=UPI0020A81E68|nr:winged helix-turn-helix domain-containing protein [Pyxidicoccus xibeiensis]MCP3144045.1 winged helix-turn-helix domain-containing protein [Pyxidicoccus xibeiensis]
MTMRKAPPRTGRRALGALTSPARQEVLGAFAEGPATVRTLAERLGRSRQALYHHLEILERTRLVEVTGEVGEGRNREKVYGLCAEGLELTDAPASRSEVQTAVRASQAMLRLTSREVSTAILASGLRLSGPERELVALRAKVRLSPQKLRELNAHLDAIHALFATTADAAKGDALYAVTLVLTPVREAGTGEGPRKRAPARRSGR